MKILKTPRPKSYREREEQLNKLFKIQKEMFRKLDNITPAALAAMSAHSRTRKLPAGERGMNASRN